jgi:hypothetical protein
MHAAPTAAVVCRCVPHVAVSFNAIYQMAVADTRTPLPRTVQRSATAVVACLRWAVDHRIT